MKRQLPAVKIVQLLIDEIDENSYMQLMVNGTRPLIMLEVPDMVKQVEGMKSEREHQQRVEMIRGQLIEEIIEMQNIPRPVEH